MSLINDAIKQANKANKDRTPAEAPLATAPTTGMQAADGRAPQPSSGSMTGMLLIAAIVVFILLGGSLLFLALRGNRSLEENSTSTVSAPTAVPDANSQPPKPDVAVDATPAGNPVADALENPLPPTFVGTSPDQAAAPNDSAPKTVAETPASKPADLRAFPELKLQGIYYRIKNPSVMINGKTLEIGDLIGDARVIQIERKDVTLELDGQQKVLRLQ